jgi:hypothetical protein
VLYTIYKITNKLDGKIYIGKHQTKDLNDGYMGSGKHLRYALNKHRIENFEKEILFQFDNEAEMNAKEAELVTEEFCLREYTYNLCAGGKGGFGYINKNVLSSEDRKQAGKKGGIANRGKKSAYVSEKLKSLHKANAFKYNLFQGHTHTDEWKANHSNIMKLKQSGDKNSQFGTMWITNGDENKKIKKIDVIPDGWRKGRCKILR